MMWLMQMKWWQWTEKKGVCNASATFQGTVTFLEVLVESEASGYHLQFKATCEGEYLPDPCHFQSSP